MGKLDKARCPKHGEYAPWLRFCPACVTKRPNNVTPVTKTLPIIHGGVTKVGDLPHTTEEVMPVEGGAPVSHRTRINTAGGGRGKGRPRKHVSNAERQRAYRERSAK